MSDSIVVGERTKWKRLFQHDAWVIYYGTLVEIEVGAEIQCAIVRPKSGAIAQRVEYLSLLRAEDKAEPQPNETDLLLKKHGFLQERPRW